MMGYMAESLHVQRASSRGVMHRAAVARDIVLPPVVAKAAMPAAIPSSGGRTSRTFVSSANRTLLGEAVAATSPTGTPHGTLPPAEIVSGSGRGVVPVSGGDPVAPEIIASVSAGMPLWPAALFAEQAPLHYANLRKPVH
jgi:hypothetical protein